MGFSLLAKDLIAEALADGAIGSIRLIAEALPRVPPIVVRLIPESLVAAAIRAIGLISEVLPGVPAVVVGLVPEMLKALAIGAVGLVAQGLARDLGLDVRNADGECRREQGE
jgi:hypothetical protein